MVKNGKPKISSARAAKDKKVFGVTNLARLKRQWELVTLIPAYGRPRSSMSLAEELMEKHEPSEDADFDAFLRKIRHDLEQLSRVIPELEVRRGSVSWGKQGPPLQMPGLSPDEVLAFGVLKKLGVDWMPGAMQKILEPYFKVAMSEAVRQVMERGSLDVVAKSELRARKWLKKVDRLPEFIAFERKKIDAKVEMVIHEALLHEYCLDIAYQGKGSIVISPQAIIQRGSRTYLLAVKRGGTNLQSFLMNRIQTARQTLGDFIPVSSADIDAHLNKGIAVPVFEDHALYGQWIKLKFLADLGTTRNLAETPLGRHQSINPKKSLFKPSKKWKEINAGISLSEDPLELEPWSEITAEVLLQEELVWWLRSMGPNIKVLEPMYLRKRIEYDLQRALANYSK